MDASEIYLAKAAPETIHRFLERPITAVIGTLNADESIHLAFVLFLWRDEKLYFETSSTTRKARNIARRPTVSFAIEGKGFMAMAEGHGRIIDGEDAHDINRTLRRKYLTEAAATTVGEAWGTVDDIAVEITPETWRSWSNRPLTQLGVEAAGDLPPNEWWISG
jgi:nitroimidazol reductase NimA-like FMN-containing flavoprotein (pyridoxamine 5'-phosphate oxidase superfamily)